MKTEKRVTKEEFEEYLKNYPHKLVRDVCGICAPPLITYNDFRFGKFPYSIVARTYLYDDEPSGYFYEPEEKRCYYVWERREDATNRCRCACRGNAKS